MMAGAAVSQRTAAVPAKAPGAAGPSLSAPLRPNACPCLVQKYVFQSVRCRGEVFWRGHAPGESREGGENVESLPEQVVSPDLHHTRRERVSNRG